MCGAEVVAVRALKIGLLHGARLAGLFALARWLTRGQLRILCYHGGAIGDESRYNPMLFCSGEFYARRLDQLHRVGGQVLPLDAAVKALSAGDLGVRCPVVLTVDDGWYSSAAAILGPTLARGMPITLYVATRVLLERSPVVDVAVHYLLWKADAGVAIVTCIEGHAPFEVDLSVPSQRQALAQQAVAWITSLSPQGGQREAALDALASDLGLDRSTLQTGSRRFHYLLPEELSHLVAKGLDVQLHGHTHRYPLGDSAALQADIAACRDGLRSMQIMDADHYCYPSGEYDSQARAVFRLLGVKSGTTCVPGLAAAGTDVDYLPRYLDGPHVSDIEFEAWLSGFDHLARRCLGRGRASPAPAT